MPNRNERVRNPGRLIVGKSGRSIEPSGSDSDHSAESGSTDDGLQGVGASAAVKAVQKQFNHVSVQTVREGRQRETRVAGQALGEAKKNGTQGKGGTKENVLY